MAIVVYAINLVITMVLLLFEYSSSSDKTIVITGFALVGLIVINLVSGLLLWLDKKPVSGAFLKSACAIPVVTMIVAALMSW